MARTKKTTTVQDEIVQTTTEEVEPDKVSEVMDHEIAETKSESEEPGMVKAMKTAKASKESKKDNKDVVTIYNSLITPIETFNITRELKKKWVEYRIVNILSEEGIQFSKEARIRWMFAVVFNDGIKNIIATTWRDALKKLKDNGKI